MKPGDVFGNLRLLRRSRESYTIASHGKKYIHSKLDCECVVCGAVGAYTKQYMFSAKHRQQEHCMDCREVRTITSERERICFRCYNLPERRPRVGLCKCGEAFSAEEFGPAEAHRGMSNIAMCEEM